VAARLSAEFRFGAADVFSGNRYTAVFIQAANFVRGGSRRGLLKDSSR